MHAPSSTVGSERRQFPRLPPDQHATFEELMAAAEWCRDDPGPFVDVEGAAEILGVTATEVGCLCDADRLPWLPTGRADPHASRVFRRAQLEVIAQARAVAERYTSQQLA